MIADSFIQELKTYCDVESVISSYVKLSRKGKNLVGLCPFHSEKSPSFFVYPQTPGPVSFCEERNTPFSEGLQVWQGQT